MKTTCKISLGFFMILVVSLTACDSNDKEYDNIIYFVDEPVIVNILPSDSVVLHTQYGNFCAPGLKQKVSHGDYLLTNFIINLDIEPQVISSTQYEQMDADTVSIMQGEMIDDYTASINDVRIFLLNQSATRFICVDSTFFVIVEQIATKNEKIAYELIANSDSIDEKGIQNLYLKSQRSGTSSGYEDKRFIPYALNLSPLLQSTDSEKKEVVFNLKFKSGVDASGKDVYHNYKHNPITLVYARE